MIYELFEYFLVRFILDDFGIFVLPPRLSYKNRPNQGGMSMMNHDQKVQIDKMDQDRNNNRLWVRNGNNGINGAIPSVETYGKINVPQYYNNCQDCDRINPDILTAFKQNPYTKSLSSY